MGYVKSLNVLIVCLLNFIQRFCPSYYPLQLLCLTILLSLECLQIYRNSLYFSLFIKFLSPFPFSRFRSISILCSLIKALERICAHVKVSKYHNGFNFFSKYQSGFRSHHGTATALLKVTDDILRAMNQRKLTILGPFDFCMAFD